MASQSTKAKKVLRIGIIQDGKIVQERMIKADEAVTVGESPKNTFVFPKTHLDQAEFTLFEAGKNGYVLRFTEQMKGKISSGGAVVALQKLRRDSSVQRDGAYYTMPLTAQDRGKVSIDGMTVLFQFVAPPPSQAVTPMQAMDFRPRLLEEDDLVYIGFLSVWFALSLVLTVYVYYSPPPEYTLEDLPPQFTEIRLAEPEVEEPEAEEAEDGEAVKAREEDIPRDNAKASDETKSAADEAKDKEALKDDVLKKSKLLAKIIGTTGSSGQGVVDNLWSDEDQGLSGIDQGLANRGITTDAGEGIRGGEGVDGTVEGIGEIGGVGGGTSNIDAGPKIVAKVTAGEGNLEEVSGDKNKFKATVTRNAGQLKYCYESRLKVIPTLEGRVVLGWSVFGGKVESVYVVSNSTGDAELADCMMRKVRRWEFPGDADGDVPSWPFVFVAK